MFLEYYREAISKFEKSLGAGKDTYCISQIAFCYRNLGEYEKALEYFQKARSLGRNDAWISLEFGLCYRDLNEYEKALEAHRLALQTLEIEQAKLNTLLQNQLDAKAQYEAVLETYQKAYNKPQESLNHRHDSKVSNIEHKLVTDKLRTALSNPAYIYVGNKPKYGANTTLPNTGSENSTFLIGLGTMIMGLFTTKLRRKSE